jgi:hypothetical protein
MLIMTIEIKKANQKNEHVYKCPFCKGPPAIVILGLVFPLKAGGGF